MLKWLFSKDDRPAFQIILDKKARLEEAQRLKEARILLAQTKVEIKAKNAKVTSDSKSYVRSMWHKAQESLRFKKQPQINPEINAKIETEPQSWREKEKENPFSGSVTISGVWMAVGILIFIFVWLAWFGINYHSDFAGLSALGVLISVPTLILVGFRDIKKGDRYVVSRFGVLLGLFDVKEGWSFHIPGVHKLIPIPTQLFEITSRVILLEGGKGQKDIVANFRTIIKPNPGKEKELAGLLPSTLLEKHLPGVLRKIIIGGYPITTREEFFKTLKNAEKVLVGQIKVSLPPIYSSFGYSFDFDELPILTIGQEDHGVEIDSVSEIEKINPVYNWLVLIPWTMFIMWIYNEYGVSFGLVSFLGAICWIYYFRRKVVMSDMAVLSSWGIRKYILLPGWWYLICPWQRLRFYDWEVISGDKIKFLFRPLKEHMNNGVFAETEFRETVRQCRNLEEVRNSPIARFYDIKGI